jgi:MYXO-CTERM domain-containing protein
MVQFAGASSITSSIQSNFNGTAIPAGDDTWFTAANTLTDDFSTNTAAYYSLSSNYSDIGALPAGDDHASPYSSYEETVAPENYTSYVAGGVVSNCGTSPTPEPAYGLPLAALLLALGWHRRSRQFSS